MLRSLYEPEAFGELFDRHFDDVRRYFARRDRHRPTVLLVTHDVDEAIILADRVLVLDSGRIGIDLHIQLPHPRSYRHHHLADYRDQLLSALGVADDISPLPTRQS